MFCSNKWKQKFNWLPFIRKAFVVPNKIHKTNMVALNYTISQGISKWSAKIVITGLLSALLQAVNDKSLRHVSCYCCRMKPTRYISSKKFSFNMLRQQIFCWCLVFMSCGKEWFDDFLQFPFRGHKPIIPKIENKTTTCLMEI